MYYKGDVRDQSLLRVVCEGAECVFHLAALPRVQYSIEHIEETHEVNVDGTFAVLCAARETGVKRVVFSSSSALYGDQEKLPITEDMATNPLSPYALHKHIGEELCRLFSRLYGVETVSLRYFNVYGPHDDPHGAYALVISKFIDQRKRGHMLTIAGDGMNTRDYTHVEDIVRANLLAMSSLSVGHGEAINIGNGTQISVREVAACIGGEITHVPERVEPKHTRADISRARILLGWEPTISFQTGITELKHTAGLV
jgi:nucleoside-diphosphate-sugar epimerase